MKHSLMLFLLMIDVLCTFAADQPYRATVAAARNRFAALDARAQMPDMYGTLSPAEEKERLCLLGELTAEDPVWVLRGQVIEDLQALELVSPLTAADRATSENLRELLLVIGGFEQRATTLPEAKSFATSLRKFVVRRDVTGAKAWAKAQ